MIASIPSATIVGARGFPVNVEVHVAKGLPAFVMLGLPDESCREARDRVRAAVMSSGFEFPERKITVNLAPPQFRKSGSGLDIAIAVGIMVANGEISPDRLTGLAFAGELGLDGSVRAIPGVAPMVGVRPDLDWVVPARCVNEARIAAHDASVRGVHNLAELVHALNGSAPWPDITTLSPSEEAPVVPDLADVKGQPVARLALEVAAAGGHHLFFVGPPGSGKTMLAQRLPGLLPDLEPDIALQVTMIHSAAGLILPRGGLITRPPFRAPHHTSSSGSLVGGGSHGQRLGEASLSHGGVLFLDEMGQFPPTALDALREAIELGYVMIGRVDSDRVPVPARFQLVGATNPCPCGGGAPGACECDIRARQRYIGRLSGPFLDRFDLRVTVVRPAVDDLLGGEAGETTAVVSQRVAVARQRAAERQGHANAALTDQQLQEFAPLSADASTLLRAEMERGRLTARGYHRVRRVARTLADLAAGETGSDDLIGAEIVATALTMRARIGHSTVGAVA